MATIVHERASLEAPDDLALAERMKTGRDRILAELRKRMLAAEASGEAA